jgi:predicted ATPase
MPSQNDEDEMEEEVIIEVTDDEQEEDFGDDEEVLIEEEEEVADDGEIYYDEEIVVDDDDDDEYAEVTTSSHAALKIAVDENRQTSVDESLHEIVDEMIDEVIEEEEMDVEERGVAESTEGDAQGAGETHTTIIEEEIATEFQRAASQRFLTTLPEDEEAIIEEFEEIIEEIVEDEDDEDLELEGEDCDDESSAWIDDGRDYTKNADTILPINFRDQFASEENDGDDGIENQDSFYLNFPDVEEVSSLEDNLSDVSVDEDSQTSISLVIEEVIEEGGESQTKLQPEKRESKTQLQPEKPASTASLMEALHESADWDTEGLLMFGEDEADDIISTSSTVGQVPRDTTSGHQHPKLSFLHEPKKNPLFFGRQMELERMRNALAGTKRPEVKNPRRLVWIYGSSGMGKTALAEAFIRENIASRPGEIKKTYFLGYGSFDERSLQAQKPFSGLVDCLEEIVDQLMGDPIGAGVTWRDLINEGLGKEARLLMTVLPNIAQLLEIEEEAIKPVTSFELSHGRLVERMRFVLRRFLKIVCRHQKVVIVLDDLHWADEDSLRLIETLLSTYGMKNFFFIGCHRGVKRTHMLPQIKTKLTNICAADIMMTPLDQNQAIEITVNYLKSLGPIAEVEGMDKLSMWMMEKSGGDPFHLHQLLRYLVENGQIELRDSAWKWDLEGLLDQEIPSNAIELVVARMQRLSPETSLVIKSAGLMGMKTFRLDFLCHAVGICSLIDKRKDDGVPMEGESTLLQHLESAIERNLIMLHSPGYYGFTHDTIRKAAALLLPKSTTKQSFLHSRFASHLQRQANSMSNDPFVLEEVMLLIADHNRLATEHIKTSHDKEKLSRSNLELAAVAIRKGSFSSAVTRIEYGMSLLDHRTKWKDTYELTLKLHLELSRVHFCRGNFGTSKIFADALLANGKSERDKIGAYELLTLLNVARNQHDQAFRIAALALKNVWGEVPSDDVENEVTKLRELMNEKSDADLLMLPEITHKKTAAKLLFLTRLAEICWMRQDFLHQDLAALKVVELTMRYGSSKFSSLAYALYGVSLARRNLHKEAYRFGHLAEMSAEAESPLGAQAIAIHHYAISYWRRPFQASLEPLEKSAGVAIDSNDMEYLSFRVGAFLSLAFTTGRRLNTGDALFRRFKEHVIAFRGRTTWLATIPFRLMLKLRDEPPGPAEKGFEQYSDSRAVQYAIFFQMIHAVFMQEMKSADKMSNKLLLKPEGVWLPVRGFMEGLIATSLARASSGKMRVKHQRKAAKIIEVLGGWAKKGLKQVYHMANLVNVELRMLSDTKMEPAQCSALYDTAIAAAAKAGFVHHQALACERAGLLFREQNDEDLTRKYLTRACELYKIWGASAKVRLIREKFPKLFDRKDAPDTKTDDSNELEIFGISESVSGPSLDFGESQIIHFDFAPAAKKPIPVRARASVSGRIEKTGTRAGMGLVPKVKIPSGQNAGRGAGRGRSVAQGRGRTQQSRARGPSGAGRGPIPSPQDPPPDISKDISKATKITEAKVQTESSDVGEKVDDANKKERRMGGLVKTLSWSKRKKKPKEDLGRDEAPNDAPKPDVDPPSISTETATAESEVQTESTTVGENVEDTKQKESRMGGLVNTMSWSKRKKEPKEDLGTDDAPNDAPNDVSNDVSNEVPNDAPNDAPNEASKSDVDEILVNVTKGQPNTPESDAQTESTAVGENVEDTKQKESIMGGLVKTISWSKRKKKPKEDLVDDEAPKDAPNPDVDESLVKETMGQPNTTESEVQTESTAVGEKVEHKKKKESRMGGLVKTISWSKRKKKPKEDRKTHENAAAPGESTDGTAASRPRILKSLSWSKRKKKSNEKDVEDANDVQQDTTDEVDIVLPKQEVEKPSADKTQGGTVPKAPATTSSSVLQAPPDLQISKHSFSSAEIDFNDWTSSDEDEEKSGRKVKSKEKEEDISDDSEDFLQRRPNSIRSAFSMKSDFGPGLKDEKKEKRIKLKSSRGKKIAASDDEVDDDDTVDLAPRRPRSLASGLDVYSDHGPRRESKLRKGTRRKSSDSKKKRKDKEVSTESTPSTIVEEPLSTKLATMRKSKAKMAEEEETVVKKERKLRRATSIVKPEKRKTPSRTRSESAMLDGSAREDLGKKVKTRSESGMLDGSAREDLGKKVKKKSKAKSSTKESDAIEKLDSDLDARKDETQTENPPESTDEKPALRRKRLSWSGKRKKKSKPTGDEEEVIKSEDGANEDPKEKPKRSSGLRGSLVKSLSWTGKRKGKSEDVEVEVEEADAAEKTPRRSKSFNMGNNHGEKLTKLKKGKKKDVTSQDKEETTDERLTKSFNMGSNHGKKLTKLRKGKKEDATSEEGVSKKVKKSSKSKRSSSKETSEDT